MAALTRPLAFPAILLVALIGAACGRAGVSAPVATSPAPVSRAIPWIATPANPLKTGLPKVLWPDQAAQDVKQIVTQVDPVLLPSAIPSGFQAQLLDSAGFFSVIYAAADGRSIMFAIVVPNPPPGDANVRQAQPTFRGVRADYQVDDATLPTSHRWLMWTEPGTALDGQPGVPYFLTTDGFTEREFWQIANSIGTIPAPVAVRPCVASDISAVFGGTNGAAGTVINSILLSNHSASACSLTGFAQIKLETAQGVELGLPQSNQPNYMAVPGIATVVMPPGQPAPQPHSATTVSSASINFDWIDCGFNGEVSGVVLTLPGTSQALQVQPNGFEAPAPSEAACDAQAGVKLQALNAGPIEAPRADSVAVQGQMVRVTFTVPGTLVAGTTVSYQVTILNVSGSPISFDTCPAYREGFTPDQMVSYQLNCASVRTLEAGASATFAMQFTVPADTAPGPEKFGWQLVGSYTDGFAGTVVTVVAR